MGANEGVIREMRIGAADTIDFGGLAGAQGVVRAQTPRAAYAPLPPQHFLDTCDAAGKAMAASKNAALASVTSTPRCSSAAGICPARAAA
jgi:hypothetical protein